MAEEERDRHTAACFARRQIGDVQAEQQAEVRRRPGEEEQHGVMKEHGSSRQQMVAVVNPVACMAHGAHSRCW